MVVLASVGTVVGLVQPASATTTIQSKGPLYNLQTYLDGVSKVMAVLNASTGDNAPMIQNWYTAAAPTNDEIVIEYEDSANVYRLKPRHTFSDDGNPHNDKCLAVRNNDSGNNIPIVSATCTYDSVNNDVWKRTWVYGGGTDYYASLFENQATGKCITTQNASDANGARLITFDCNRKVNQLWVVFG